MADPIDAAMEKAQAHLEAQATETTTPETQEQVETPAPEAVEVQPAAEPKPSQPRADDGRFTKAPKPKAAPKTTQEPAAAAPQGDVHGAARAAPPAGQGTADGAASPSPAAPSAEPTSDGPSQLPSAKLPPGWKGVPREDWAKLPMSVREEWTRRERDLARLNQESTNARKIAQSFQDEIGPLEGIARANGLDGMKLAGEGARAMAAVYAGAPQSAAQVIISAIRVLDQRTGGKALELLNAGLSGEHPAPQPTVDPRAEIRRALEEERAAAQAAENQRAVQEFLASEPEFLSYVQDDVAEILRLDRARGGNMTPQQAYDRACKLSEEVQSVLSKRKEAERVRTATAATQAATAATQVSLRSTPAAPVRAKPKGLDAALSAAREKLGM